MSIKPILLGIGTFIPGYSYIPVLSRASMKRTGGTDSARYCYAVWLRHLVMAFRNGLTTVPPTVAELGPGDSLGIGLAALLSGSHNCYAFDVVKFANAQENLKIFEELVELFQMRARIPDQSEFPAVKPYLNSYEFPGHVLTQEHLTRSLSKGRLDSIRDAIVRLGDDEESQRQIGYCAPWDKKEVIKENSVDMIYSQAVLEHVNDLEHTYRALNRWLKPGGFMSHQIDFKCHGYAQQWNGHWAYSDLTWRLIQGTRPYSLNRQPHSTHVDLLRKNGFQITCDQTINETSGITRRQLARRLQHLSDEDLVTSSAFMQAVKAAVPASVNFLPS